MLFPSKDQLRDCFSYSQVMRGLAVNIDEFVQTHTPFSLIKVVQSKIKCYLRLDSETFSNNVVTWVQSLRNTFHYRCSLTIKSRQKYASCVRIDLR